MMRTLSVVLGLVAVLWLAATTAQSAFAQGKRYVGATGASSGTPSHSSRGGSGFPGGLTGIILSIPHDKSGVPRHARRRKKTHAKRIRRRNARTRQSTNDNTVVAREVLTEVPNDVSTQALSGIASRHRLTLLERQSFQFSGSTLIRWRILGGRSVAALVRELASDNAVTAAQPNFVYTLQDRANRTANEGDPAQYELRKLRLLQAHRLATGKNILVAIVDSGVDASHPELKNNVVDSFDAVKFLHGLNKHGTSIASLICAHGTMLGAAPNAHILAARVFGPTGSGATFNIIRGLDWAAARGARFINMSFAGPSDPATRRFVEFAHNKGIVLVASAGNAGPKSPPLYPAAYPNVIAVSATDARDRSPRFSNRGRYIAVAAPGVDLLVAVPDGAFETASGTSFSAAEVSGVVALMLQHNPHLNPDQIRSILQSTARDLGKKGRDTLFGAGLVNAYAALLAESAPPMTKSQPMTMHVNVKR